jgi:hypothetical protein
MCISGNLLQAERQREGKNPIDVNPRNVYFWLLCNAPLNVSLQAERQKERQEPEWQTGYKAIVMLL